jgi:hypothetical protein
MAENCLRLAQSFELWERMSRFIAERRDRDQDGCAGEQHANPRRWVSNTRRCAMLDTLQAMGLLTVAEIVGPILLAAGLIYGIYHSRRRRSQEPRDTKGTVYAQDKS